MERIRRAMQADLAASGLFQEVVLVEPGGARDGLDGVVKTTLLSSRFETCPTSYCLGAAGVLLWILPIPMGWQEAEVEFDLVLEDRERRELWHERITGRASDWFTLYTAKSTPFFGGPFSREVFRYGSNDEGIDEESIWACHAAALRQCMRRARESLLPALSALARPGR